MSKKRPGQRYTAAQFIAAIPGSGGIISTIAKRVGCDWRTAKTWIADFPTVAAAYEHESEAVNDIAEGALIKSINKGNTRDAKWWLSRVRRDRFSERKEVTGPDGSAVQVIHVKIKEPDDAE